ncbi:MAG TPA: LysM peptidoglycan-binding domain-containing protein, partial [Streptosporangiaceae bacterium]
MTGRRGPQAAAGIAALVTLVALVGGLPVLLYRLGGSPLPGHLPGLAQVGHGLLHQESPDVFLAVVRDVSWLAWAAFTLAVLTEVQAMARRRTPPRLWLGGLQGAAGRLVALAALTFTTAPAGALLATPQPVSAVTAVTVVPQADVTAIPQAASPQAGSPQTLRLVSDQLPAQPSAAPKHAAPHNTASTALPGGQGQGLSMGIFQLVTVRPGDCLWSIAQHYLGSGDRYREIVQLNQGHDMGNGQQFRNPSVIQPGWVLHVPAQDAGGPGAGGSHGSGAHGSG